jgi:hypothetical protein
MAKPFTVKFKVEGTQAMRAQLRQLSQDYPRETNLAIFREGYGVFVKSQELVPVDTGNLRGTALVNAVTDQGGVGKFEIIYPANYALVVHEIHDTHSKFLETPLFAATQGMAKRMRDDIFRLVTAKVKA